MEEIRLDAARLATPPLESSWRSEPGPRGLDFGRMVGELLGDTNRQVNDAERQARLFAEGKSGLVETVVALGKADLSLRFVVELRNRFVEAYRQITRISA